MKRLVIATLLPLTVGGCASILSSQAPTSGRTEGLVYYLPKKLFLVDVTVASGKVTDVSLSTSQSIPDLNSKYVLQYGTNLVGKNTLEVQAGENSLLTTAKGSVESGVGDALKALAASLAATTVSTADAPQLAEGPPCKEDGKHAFAFEGVTQGYVCGKALLITISKLKSGGGGQQPSNDSSYSSLEAGIFYRSNEPYLMTAKGTLNRSSIVFSPTQSATHFLPMSRALFAKSNVEFGLVDGVVTSYKQNTEGELIALLKLPADVLSAYFAAVGTIFDAFKDAQTSKAGALAEELKLQLEKAKVDACREAIKNKDKDLIASLSCAGS